MIPELRAQFIANWTPAKYADLLARLEQETGSPAKFRHSETPCFYPRDLLAEMAAAGRELIRQIVGNEPYLERARREIPPEFLCPHEAPHPMFVQADFGLAATQEGGLKPMLVEIQGFPSLYAYQPVMAEQYRQSYGLAPDLRTFFGDFSLDSYRRFLSANIVGRHEPENVVLLEIDPLEQKTLADFTLTEKLTGVRTVNIREVRKQGRRLFYRVRDREIPIERIYNRAIADELLRKRTPLEFRFSDDLEVEWAGHPSWYFLLSKFSIPWLKHPSVPRTEFLDRVGALPRNLDNWVLKPLYSFAGLGVRIGPSREEVESIPAEQRAGYILQERVDFLPVIQTPEGPTKAEIRVMYIWPDGAGIEGLVPCTTIVRMGRGKMMGVDHNRDMTWVGASAAFSE